jgi:hypothetical protein
MILLSKLVFEAHLPYTVPKIRNIYSHKLNLVASLSQFLRSHTYLGAIYKFPQSVPVLAFLDQFINPASGISGPIFTQHLTDLPRCFPVHQFTSEKSVYTRRHISKRHCSSRWILLKVGSFDRSLLKREARRYLEKSARPPSCESPLKIPRYLVQLLAITILIPNADMKIHFAFVNSGTRSVVW